MYQHHVMLKTPVQLSAQDALKWYQAVKEYGPEDIVMPYMRNNEEIAMEYGIMDGDEFEHCLTVPLARNLTQEETGFIVDAWDYMYHEDFDIEISNQYDPNGMGDFENTFEIDPEVKDQAVADMQKWHHNRWVEAKVNEGWRHGSYFSSKEKTHPALRNWDLLPESHRRAPEFTDQEVYEWLHKNGLIK